MFKLMDTIANPLGFCQFYHTNPPHSNIITGPKSAASTPARVKCLVEKAKDLGWPFIIIVFEGGNVTLLGLLQELHLWLTLSHIPIFTPEKANLGQKTRISCCPICTYIVKNDSAFLNHIVICHYWSSFACAKCLKFVTSFGQQMKKHFLKCCEIKDMHEKTDSQGSKSSKSHGGGKCSSKPKKDKGHKCSKEEKGDKPHRSDSKSSSKTASQEQVKESPHCSKCLAGSSTEGGHHKSDKKSKKHGKKSHKSHKKSCQ